MSQQFEEFKSELPAVENIPEYLTHDLPGELVTYRVESEFGNELVWGKKLTLDLESLETEGKTLREVLSEKGWVIPKSIKNIEYITLKPDEHLDPKERLLKSQKGQDVSFLKLAHPSRVLPLWRTLTYDLHAVFGNNSDARSTFTDCISVSSDKNILRIFKGHGGGEPLTVGEVSQSNSVWAYGDKYYSYKSLLELLSSSNAKELRERGAKRIQSPGNHIEVRRLIKDDCQNVGGMVFITCNPSNDVIEGSDFPIGYVNGISRALGGSDEIGYPRRPVVWDSRSKVTKVFEDKSSEIG